MKITVTVYGKNYEVQFSGFENHLDSARYFVKRLKENLFEILRNLSYYSFHEELKRKTTRAMKSARRLLDGLLEIATILWPVEERKLAKVKLVPLST